jgi:hypothetical protein
MSLARGSFLFVFFKYTALSHEKREGVFPLLVNIRTHSVQLVQPPWSDLWTDIREPDHAPRGSNEDEMLRSLRAAFCAASQVVTEKLDPFRKSLEKRLNRDIVRVFEYYETLRTEAEKVFQKKAVSERPPFEQEEEVAPRETSREKLMEKLQAIEGERRWKIQDLTSQYAMRATIEPVCLVQIETQSPVFLIEIRRRLSTRIFPLTYNPLLKQMDPLPYENCFYSRGRYSICDEKLHILCGNCFQKCPDCRREYCPLCHRGCPRCGNGKNASRAI